MSFSWTVITFIMNIVSLLFCTIFDSSIVSNLKIFVSLAIQSVFCYRTVNCVFIKVTLYLISL